MISSTACSSSDVDVDADADVDIARTPSTTASRSRTSSRERIARWRASSAAAIVVGAMGGVKKKVEKRSEGEK